MKSINTITHGNDQAQLIPVYTNTIGGEEMQTCSAKELHSFLESGRVFSSWINGRIKKYGFSEGVDWEIIYTQSGVNSNRGRPGLDYVLSVEMAKELSMIENNEKGREARRYFIEMEKKALAKEETKPLPSIQDVDVSKVAGVLESTMYMAEMFGLEGNQKLLSANQATYSITGVNVMELMQIPALVAPVQEVALTPTELGRELGLSAQSINILLESLGLQVQRRDTKDHKKWELTDSGKAYGLYQDTGKRNGGVPVQQVKWYKSVLNLLKQAA